MLKVEIHCPHHGKLETLELPDEYSHFKGEVRCGAGEDSMPIKIEIRGAKIISVERS